MPQKLEWDREPRLTPEGLRDVEAFHNALQRKNHKPAKQIETRPEHVTVEMLTELLAYCIADLRKELIGLQNQLYQARADLDLALHQLKELKPDD